VRGRRRSRVGEEKDGGECGAQYGWMDCLSSSGGDVGNENTCTSLGVHLGLGRRDSVCYSRERFSSELDAPALRIDHWGFGRRGPWGVSTFFWSWWYEGRYPGLELGVLG